MEIVMGRDTPNLILQGGFANGAGAFLSDMASTSPTGGLPDILVPGVYTIRARTIQGHVASAPLIIMENVEPRPGELLVPTVTQANGAVATVVENGKLQVVAAGFVPGEVVLLEIVIGGDPPTLILPSGFANDASAFLSINDSLPGAVVPGVYTVKASTIQGHVASAPLIVVATK